MVGDYLGSNLRLFAGRSADAESTVLPSLASWVQESISEVPEARSSEDHGLVIWLNLPTAGIIGASKYDFLLTSVTNLLTMMKKNSIALIVHPNRAAQMQPNRTKVTKKESGWLKLDFTSNGAPTTLDSFYTGTGEKIWMVLESNKYSLLQYVISLAGTRRRRRAAT